MIKYLLWDFDDTIMHTVTVFIKTMTDFLTKRNDYHTPEEIAQYRGLTMKEIMNIVAPGEDVESNLLIFKDLQEKYLDEMHLKENAFEILEYTANKGYKNILVSNRRQVSLLELLDTNPVFFKLKKYFTYIRGKTPNEIGKPNRQAFDLIVNECEIFKNAKPNECCMIGDSESDLLFAKNLGFAKLFIIKNEYENRKFTEQIIKEKAILMDNLIELKNYL